MNSGQWLYFPLVLAAVTLCNSAFPAEGAGVRGGDECERRFKEIRNDLESWILKGGPAGLHLPSGLTTGEYSERMLKYISGTATARIKCVGKDDRFGEGDPEYPVAVGRTPKTCINFTDKTGIAQIVCNWEKFLGTDEVGQYRLNHHEYAGLAGVEVGNDDDSDYRVSDQLTSYLEVQDVRKLAIRKPPGSETRKSRLSEALYELPGDTELKLARDIPVEAYELSIHFEDKIRAIRVQRPQWNYDCYLSIVDSGKDRIFSKNSRLKVRDDIDLNFDIPGHDLDYKPIKEQEIMVVFKKNPLFDHFRCWKDQSLESDTPSIRDFVEMLGSAGIEVKLPKAIRIKN